MRFVAQGPLPYLWLVLVGATACSSSGTSPFEGQGASAGASGSSAGSGGASGSAGSGGAAGSSGVSGSGGGAPACALDSDCRIHADCCACEAVHRDENPPSCNAQCALDACSAVGVISARCDDGQCVTLSNCRELPTPTQCDPTPPACGPGELPVNGNFGGQCFTGECVDATRCVRAPDCAACGPDAYCVEDVVISGAAGGSSSVSHRCRPLPAACGGAVSCDCSNACGDFAECSAHPSGVRCTEAAP